MVLAQLARLGRARREVAGVPVSQRFATTLGIEAENIRLPFVAKIGPCQQSFAEVTASPNRSLADKRFHQASRRRRSSF